MLGMCLEQKSFKAGIWATAGNGHLIEGTSFVTQATQELVATDCELITNLV